jgi:23S rRNA pseudouridine1911/1915/1917 synthase
MNLQVLHEDNHLIAVNKPAGVLVHGDETGDVPLSEAVKEYIKIRYNKPGDVFLGVIHRLDRPVSGVVIYARTSKGLARMNEVFKKREIQKTYLAITRNRPAPMLGSLTHYIAKDRSRNVAKAFPTKSNQAEKMKAKKSTLDYEMIGEIDSRCLIRVNPHTGRPHQIRVQLASMGCPIVGDVKYGDDQPNDDGSIHLHCRSMSFEHPVKREPVVITADPPADVLWRKFDSILGI